VSASRLMWFGLLAPAAAFTTFHVGGYALTEAECNVAGRSASLGLDVWTVVLTALAALVTGLGCVAAVLAWRRTRDCGDEPPGSRVHFMSVMGMTTGPLILLIILMAGIGALVLPACVQGAEDPPIVRPTTEVEGSRELGAQLFAANCATCHGSRGEGVSEMEPQPGASEINGIGPSLQGVGAQSADFYLTTGYMPLADPYDQPDRSKPPFRPNEIQALTDFVASLGPGPPIPEPQPEEGTISDGLELFTEYCAGCHQVVAEGGVVTGAKVPSLDESTPRQVWEAVRIGPYVMPHFSSKHISDDELNDIVAYVRYAQDPRDEGGWGIDHLGAYTEGLIAWFVGMGVLVLICVAIGSRVKKAA